MVWDVLGRGYLIKSAGAVHEICAIHSRLLVESFGLSALSLTPFEDESATPDSPLYDGREGQLSLHTSCRQSIRYVWDGMAWHLDRRVRVGVD